VSPGVLIPVLAVPVACQAIVSIASEIIRGLRAKKAARVILARAAASDGPLHELAQKIGDRRLNDAEVEAAARTIEDVLKNQGNLSEATLRHIGHGLNQPNRTGERRYIEDLMSAA
jgi:hypothetical protein